MPEDFGALFDAAAPDFEYCSPGLWAPAGQLAVAAAGLRPGERVLDACCGAGASAVPAARAVGPDGRVRAVDLSQGLVERAGAAAAAAGVSLDLRVGDATDPAVIGSRYDAVICVYGVFFFPDMDAGGRALLAAARPGGRLVVGAWGEHALGSLGAVLATAIEPLRPEAAGYLRDYVSPSAQIGTGPSLEAWLEGLGGTGTSVAEHHRTVPLDADLAWHLVTGSAMRVLLAGLDADEAAQLRANLRGAVVDAPDLRVDTVIGVTHAS